MDLPSPTIDAHAHLWSDASGLAPREGHVESLIAMADRYELEAVVFSPIFGGMSPSIEQVRAGNRAAAELRDRDARMVPLARVHPAHGDDALEGLRRCVGQMGFAGAKVWIFPADAPEMDPLVEYLTAAGRPLLIHAMHKATGNYEGESDPVQVAELARRHPDATIVLPHIGGDFIYTLGSIAGLGNVVVDTSGSFCETDFVARAVRVLGARRVLFGTDAPGADFIGNLAKVCAADLDCADLQRVVHDNARELFG